MQSISLAIQGMTCGHCVTTVRSALTTVPGVASAQVTLGHATIALADGANQASTALAAAEAITDAGYEAAISDGAPSIASASASGTTCCAPPAASLHALGRPA